MLLSWIKSPYLNLDYIAAKLYGQRSRMYQFRLQRKISGVEPFEPWEIQQLTQLKEELLTYFMHESSLKEP